MNPQLLMQLLQQINGGQGTQQGGGPSFAPQPSYQPSQMGASPGMPGGGSGGMTDLMRQMQGGGYGSQGGYGAPGPYGGGWGDIVGRHMMQRQQAMQPQPPGQTAPGSQRRGWTSGFGGQPGMTPPGAIA